MRFHLKLHRLLTNSKKFSILCIVLIFIFIIVYQNVHSGVLHSAKNYHNDNTDVLYMNINKLKRQVKMLESKIKEYQIPLPSTSSLPTIYIVTPTHTRPHQLAELNRLRTVFLHIENLWWIVIEDHEFRTQAVIQFLLTAGIPYTHLNQPTPAAMKPSDPKVPRWKYPRGVLQRNAGINWLRQNCSPNNPAVVYFADDDNSYTIELFDEMRYTQRVSVWPVGLVGGVMVERPVCDCTTVPHTVTDWIVGWKPQREFPTDMAGFAINIKLLLENQEAVFRIGSRIGHLETDFLSQLVRRIDLEPRASCCTKVLVWHMNAVPPKLTDEARLREEGRRTDENIIV